MPPAEALFEENRSLKQEIAVLRAQIGWLQKQLFGGGQSERMDRAQLLLKLGELEKLADAKIQTVTYERPAPRPEKRTLPAENFAHLPVKETLVIDPEEVKAEPEKYERIGEERSFEVGVVPPQLYKREIIRPKYRRKDDKSLAPLVAPAPKRAVAGGYASAELLAWIAMSKYVEHIPLYRMEQMSERWGAKLPRQSMADWIRIASDWLESIYDRMHQDLLASGYVQADETPVKCNDPDEKRGGTTQGYLWVLSRPGGDVVFDWRLSRRHGELPHLLTDDYRGILQSDGYPAYEAYAESHPGVVWLCCWAHARRKYFEAQAEDPKAVRVALRLIARLYRLEREWDQAAITPAERTRRRGTDFARTLKWLRALALRLRTKHLPQSLLGKASNYLLARWPQLTAHIEHGQTKLDTNLVENAIRPSAIGKKNWMFIGHPDAGQRSAIIYSVVVSCQRHGKDPFAYLRDVLTRLPKMTNRDDLAPLLPINWQPS